MYRHGDCTPFSGGVVQGDFDTGECVRGLDSGVGLCVVSLDELRPGLEATLKQAVSVVNMVSTLISNLPN